MRKCKIEGCDKEGNGGMELCRMHYTRYRRHGDPLLVLRKKNVNVIGYLHNVVLPHDGEECIFWPFSKAKGYGQVYKDGKLQLVSRIVCEAENGPPPTPKHQAAHSCGKGHLACCNRKHLSWKTPAENSADKIVHGTQTYGESSPTSKLSEEQVKTIFSLRGIEKHRQISKRFGISMSHVSYIQRGLSWKHIQHKESKDEPQ